MEGKGQENILQQGMLCTNLNYSTPGRHCLVLSDDDAPKQPGAPGYILDTYKFSDRASIFSSFPVNT
jgi:hypothetical protein